ncbi:very short patch repair endonuclease [Krasilnikovia sp. MM14-A1004]|uniref:very short patch repair endonuclease n=1 Tax=Krasilnikovia sp. MM14-A1004 TaxID=3373541 RepID=UPI00399CD546
MKKQRSADTGLELRIRRDLYRRGLRYRLQTPLVPGTRRKVDLAFITPKIAVFLDGCFWHRCPEHGTSPRANGEWWAEKLAANVARDRDTDRRLSEAGWTVVRVWEHEDSETAAARIEQLVRQHSPRANRPTSRPATTPAHGTLSTYSNHGCRCADCRRANAQYQQQLLARYRQHGGRGEHGTDYRYRTGCRCDRCRAAHAAEDREYRHRRQRQV